MNKIIGRGVLRHRFWGNYSAAIGLQFDDPQSANDAQKILGEPWVQSDKHPQVLMCLANSEALDPILDKLVRYGGNREKIVSMARSVDYGEPFIVEIPVVPAEQTKLF